MDNINVDSLKSILEELKSLRSRWCSECVDDAEEMWEQIPGFLSDSVPLMEEALCLPYSISPLTIISAKYGANDTYIDVTKQIVDLATTYFIEDTIRNKLFPTDPIFGVKKELIVVYELNGIQQTIKTNEGDVLMIGKKL